MPASLDGPPSGRSGVQIFSLEDIHAISQLPPLPAEAADGAAEASSLERACGLPSASRPAVEASAPLVPPIASPADFASDVSHDGSLASTEPCAAARGVEGERFPERREPRGSGTRRLVVSHFSAEEIGALEQSPAQAPALELPDDIWLYCLRSARRVRGASTRRCARPCAARDGCRRWRCSKAARRAERCVLGS